MSTTVIFLEGLHFLPSFFLSEKGCDQFLKENVSVVYETLNV